MSRTTEKKNTEWMPRQFLSSTYFWNLFFSYFFHSLNFLAFHCWPIWEFLVFVYYPTNSALWLYFGVLFSWITFCISGIFVASQKKKKNNQELFFSEINSFFCLDKNMFRGFERHILTENFLAVFFHSIFFKEVMVFTFGYKLQTMGEKKKKLENTIFWYLVKKY